MAYRTTCTEYHGPAAVSTLFFRSVIKLTIQQWRSPVSYTHLDVYKRQVDSNGLVFGLVLKTDPEAAVREFRTRAFPSWSPWMYSRA